jgi:signal transduction histidine kinase
MDANYDYKKYAVLYVDDNRESLESFEHAFSDTFRIYTAPSAEEGYEVLKQHKDDIGLLMTDQRMPGKPGVWLLEKCRQLDSRIIRILVTAFTDFDAAVTAVNSGSIYKFIMKPWRPAELETHLKRGLEFYMVQMERDQLLREKMSVLHNMMVADRIVSLGVLASGLNHHIRNALQAVQTFVDLAPAKMQQEKMDAASIRNPEFWQEYYKTARNQIAKINNLLKDVRTASERPGSDFSEKVKLAEVIRANVEQLKENLVSKNVTLEVAVPEDLPELCVDRPKFSRLFELLLRDELEFLPNGSQIRITATLDPGAKHVHVEVTDNGPGLPREALRLVYDPFVANDRTPLEYGVHLMACCFIVHHHSGHIEARNIESGGTQFVLDLPLNPVQHSMNGHSEQDFLHKALLNNQVWENLITS